MALVLTDDQHYKNIANAIRSQNGTEQTYLPSEMSPAISALPILDTSDATAMAVDIAGGKTAYVNGEKITGIVGEVASGEILNYVPNSSPTFQKDVAYGISLTAEMTQDTLLRRQSYFNIMANSSDFGDATPADVISGKTFTSSSGVKVTGTLSSDVGIDTSDATASATDIASGKTAYVNRDKITGTLTDIPAGAMQLNVSTPREYTSDTFVVSEVMSKDRIIRSGVEIRIPMKKSSFGTATAEDVAAGVTFTSSSGYAISGTAIHPAVIKEISVTAQENIVAGDTVYVESNSNAYVALSGNISLVSGNTISIGYAPYAIALGDSGTVKVIAMVTCS